MREELANFSGLSAMNRHYAQNGVGERNRHFWPSTRYDGQTPHNLLAGRSGFLSKAMEIGWRAGHPQMPSRSEQRRTVTYLVDLSSI
jgi:hypothetical protein